MSADEAQRSAKDALAKLADELKTRRADLAHRMGLEVPAKAVAASAINGATGQGEASNPSVETLIQAAVEALGPRYEAPAKPAAEKSVTPIAAPKPEPPAAIVVSEPASPAAEAAPSALEIPSLELPLATVEPAAPELDLPATSFASPVPETLVPPLPQDATKSGYAWPLPAAKNGAGMDGSHHPAPIEVLRPVVPLPAETAAFVAIPEKPQATDIAEDHPASVPAAIPPPAEPPRPFVPPAGAAKPARTAQPASLASRTAHAIVHSLDDARTRSVAGTYFPMLVAVLALAAAIYQGYLFHAGLDVVQRNVARGDYLRTCRDLIESYYTVKQKVGVLMPAADRSNVAGAARVTEANRIDAQAAVARFGALGTYLAAVQDPGTRSRYAELMRTLTGTIDTARTTQLPDIDKMFEPADKLFAVMNDDCTRLSRPVRM